MAGLSFFAMACGTPQTPAESPDSARGDRRETSVSHEACDTGGAYAVGQDVNGDGRPDLTKVIVNNTERCRSVDLNFDGRIDVWVYRDAAGQVRRRESDYDRDGRIDEIALYRGGELVERQRATTLRGELDTWHYYDQGRLVRTARDADGDAMIDQWWEYSRPGKSQCALVHTDADHDGHPDPGSTIDLCADSAMEVAVEDEEPVMGLGQSNQLPVEVETPPEGASEGVQDQPAEGTKRAPPPSSGGAP